MPQMIRVCGFGTCLKAISNWAQRLSRVVWSSDTQFQEMGACSSKKSTAVHPIDVVPSSPAAAPPGTAAAPAPAPVAAPAAAPVAPTAASRETPNAQQTAGPVGAGIVPQAFLGLGSVAGPVELGFGLKVNEVDSPAIQRGHPASTFISCLVQIYLYGYLQCIFMIFYDY